MKKKKYFGSFLMKYLKGQKKAMILVAVFFIGNIVLQILSPQILSYFIDSAESGKILGYISVIVLMYPAYGRYSHSFGIEEFYYCRFHAGV